MSNQITLNPFSSFNFNVTASNGNVIQTVDIDYKPEYVDLVTLPTYNNVPEVVVYFIMVEDTSEIIRNNRNKKLWSSLRAVKCFLNGYITKNTRGFIIANDIPMDLVLIRFSTKAGMYMERARTIFPTSNTELFPTVYDRVTNKINNNKFYQDKYNCWYNNIEVICKDELDLFLEMTEPDKIPVINEKDHSVMKVRIKRPRILT